MEAHYILIVSIVLQIVATFLALRLVWITKKKITWIFIALAISLMTLRRGITLYHEVSRSSYPDLLTEIIALAISLLMAVGLVLVTSLFRAIKQSEETIIKLNKRNQMILNAAREGIIGLDLVGQITFANPSAAALTQYEIEELIGKDAHSLLHHSKPNGSPYPEEECPIYDTFLKGISRNNRNEVFWKKGGTSFEVAYSGAPIREDGRIVGAVVTFLDISEVKQAELERERLINELRDALAQVRTLKGYLPICAHCKKIRNDKGYWEQIEKYIRDHSEAEFSHGICPDCAKKLYPEFSLDDK